MFVAACGLVVATIALLLNAPLWFSEPALVTAARSLPATEEPLPVARSSQVQLLRAQRLAAGGHLRDALQLLDAIRPTDAFRPDADRLTTEIQRKLLQVAHPPVYAGQGADENP
jgi:hypothetical protein